MMIIEMQTHSEDCVVFYTTLDSDSSGTGYHIKLQGRGGLSYHKSLIQSEL